MQRKKCKRGEISGDFQHFNKIDILNYDHWNVKKSDCFNISPYQ